MLKNILLVFLVIDNYNFLNWEKLDKPKLD